MACLYQDSLRVDFTVCRFAFSCLVSRPISNPGSVSMLPIKREGLGVLAPCSIIQNLTDRTCSLGKNGKDLELIFNIMCPKASFKLKYIVNIEFQNQGT